MMKVSREAKIVIGVLSVAGAGFVWVNLLSQDDYGPVFAQPVEASLVSPVAVPAVEPAAVGVVAREVVIHTLPLLVTAPPELELALAEGETQALEIARPEGRQRASVNPFSPIVVRAPTPVQAPTPAPRIQEVAIPPAPAGINDVVASAPPVRQPIAAPPPAPVAPAAQSARSLPRPLPSGTLPAAPEILRSARVAEATPVRDLGQIAALRVPTDSPALEADAASVPEPVVSVEIQPIAEVRSAVAAQPDAPLFAGANGLARYLRDNNIRFTGAVLGPVGVAIFRSSESNSPIMVSLGQRLLDTDIVLTDLSGAHAELTQDGAKQTLILDSRR